MHTAGSPLKPLLPSAAGGSSSNVSYRSKLLGQVSLNVWRRYCELKHNPWELAKIFLIPTFFFALVLLFYLQFAFLFNAALIAPGYFEGYLIVVGFWVLILRSTSFIINDKSSKIKESMKMMGLYDSSYYLALLITDGVVLGAVLSLICALFGTFQTDGSPGPGPAVLQYFNGAPFGDVLSLCFCFCLAAIPYSLFIGAFFDSPGMGMNVNIFVLLGIYACNVVGVFAVDDDAAATRSAHTAASLLPTYALQIGCQSLSYPTDAQYPSLDAVRGMLLLDACIYSFLAWYLSKVLPSQFGVSEHPLFLFYPSYWTGTRSQGGGSASTSNPVLREGRLQRIDSDVELAAGSTDDRATATDGSGTGSGRGGAADARKKSVPIELVDETYVGKPGVVIKNLRKTFGNQLAVNDLSFDMYEGQIFALLGHNGAGKSTLINILTGQLAADGEGTGESGAWIHGHSIHSDMDQIRRSMGVCPQHDVLFEGLTVYEHIVFFAMLKGASAADAAKEALHLAKLFHLERRLNHCGSELSGGQKRKLSVAIAICAGSKFVLLDEPTAGMDPLARRELWDLLSALRHGRTILLTTHYMDECNVLGDRTAIINLGGLACLGSNAFLKTQFGAGYKLVCNSRGQTPQQAQRLLSFLQLTIPGSRLESVAKTVGSDNTANYVLPFNAAAHFQSFFAKFEDAPTREGQFGIHDYGIGIPSLEDVFLAVGGDHTVAPQGGDAGLGLIAGTGAGTGAGAGGEGAALAGIGSKRKYTPNLISQVRAIASRRWRHAMHDVVTLPTLLLPAAAAIGAVFLYTSQTPLVKGTDELDVALNNILKAFLVGLIYYAGFLTVPGLLVDFLITERDVRLRNLLTVMGCDFRAFWLGNFLADIGLLLLPMLVMFITWAVPGMDGVSQANGGQAFGLMLFFLLHLVSFSYFCSYFFQTAKMAAAFMPLVILVLFIAPVVIILISLVVWKSVGGSAGSATGVNLFAYVLYGVCIFSPQGAMLVGFMNTVTNLGSAFSPGTYPQYGTVLSIMLAEAVGFFLLTYWFDVSTVRGLTPQTDPHFDPHVLDSLHPDVIAERGRTLNTADASGQVKGPPGAALVVNRLRKVFPSKRGVHGADVVATEDVAFSVNPGECLGLLGANGAGKSTTISMCTRHLIPTSGDATVSGYSVLGDFPHAAQNLGVVTQNNSLWDLLTVDDHLRLFARLRGVPEDILSALVDATLDQMELRPHAHKLSHTLSGGMKRKLCVAISLIGDPSVVLLDEPSAGLDPKSRRNLWNVILQTMSHRAVVLTTHSLEEAEALCGQIAIMVRGQIRVIGSHQHLKNNFGSGFELTAKIKATTEGRVAAARDGILALVLNAFPQARFVSCNGGILLTFAVPREHMDIGKAFAVLEAAKSAAGSDIEEYGVSQPTLEQVFIRTVNEHTPMPGKRVPSAALLRLLSLAPNTSVSFKVALQAVQQYVAAHNLKDPSNNSRILSDPALDEALQVHSRGPCTFYGLSSRLQDCAFVSASAAQVMRGQTTRSSDYAAAYVDLESSSSPNNPMLLGYGPGDAAAGAGVGVGVGVGPVNKDLDVSAVLDMMEAEEEADGENALAKDRNKCGLTSRTVNYSAAGFCCVGILCLFLGITGAINYGSSNSNSDQPPSGGTQAFLRIMTGGGVVMLVTAVVCCCCMVCPCCRKPPDLEL